MRTDIRQEARRRVLTLDGAMGTMIQRLMPSYGGCNDALVIDNPELILDIHRQYIDAGADIIETCTFNANAISLEEYGLSDRVYDINLRGARLAREAAGEEHYVAGSMGPTRVSLTIGDEASFDELARTYSEQARGLIEGGVDLLLIETAFDPLNAKAAIYGAEQAMEEVGREIPIMVSATLNENGRLLSGQSLEAFFIAISHCRPFAFGLNCGFGVEQMAPYIERLQGLDCLISMHANAGLPDELGRYRQTPGQMSFTLRRMLERGMLNIVGGCCGTTPAHIREIAALARTATPRAAADRDTRFALSANEAMHGDGFIKVGERCNVAGSRNFLNMIREGNLGGATATAAKQIGDGAAVIDINMDDGMLDARREMTRFVRRLGLDPICSKAPLMIDSSDFNLIEQTLKLTPGRSIVNSISLKEGEEIFLDRARRIRRLGAAVMVMAFDERGQADTLPRRIEICARAYRLLTEKAGFRGHEIVFDPNVLAVATGMPGHETYALDFIKATEWITRNLPGAIVSGGVSNLSFSFRGKNNVRKAMHALFIDHAREAGLGMAIVNPAAPMSPTSDMEPELLQAIDDVLLNRSPEATARLIELAGKDNPAPSKKTAPKEKESPQATLADNITSGNEAAVISEVEELLGAGERPLDIINGQLMDAMNIVGAKFGAGELFLPQVVMAASVMRKAIDRLTPLIEANAETASTGRPRMILATVKGDVHDIGKNIVGTVMRCAGFEVIDLGVMVPSDKIIDEAEKQRADAIGLSGLITPSLREMCRVAQAMEERGLKIPLFVGGATTSEMHTAVKIAPLYSGPVVRTPDAATLALTARKLTELAPQIRREQQRLREEYAAKEPPLSIEEARSRSEATDDASPTPLSVGKFDFHPSVSELTPLMNWRAFLGEWSMTPDFDNEQVKALLERARLELERLEPTINARVIIAPARRGEPEEIMVGATTIATPRALRPNPVSGTCPALADYVATAGDHIGLFAVSVNADFDGFDDYTALMRRILCHRLAEAATQWLHSHACRELWGLDGTHGIRPAVGYPSLPDHSLIFSLDRLLRLRELGITLTENGGMHPDASTCGIIIANPRARYFSTLG